MSDVAPIHIDEVLAEALASDEFSKREKALLKALAPIARIAGTPGTMDNLQRSFGHQPSGDFLRDHMEHALKVFLRATTKEQK